MSQETEFGKLKDDHLKTVVKVAEIENLLSEKKDLENDIRRTCLDRLETLENQIQKMENVLKQKESHLTQKKKHS